jgi:hypothetical protein
MARDHINEIGAFLAVARERSFTRAAAQLGVPSFASSHIYTAARFGMVGLTQAVTLGCVAQNIRINVRIR